MHLIVTECRPQLVLVDAVRIPTLARMILDGLALPSGSLDLDLRVKISTQFKHTLRQIARLLKTVMPLLCSFQAPVATNELKRDDFLGLHPSTRYRD